MACPVRLKGTFLDGGNYNYLTGLGAAVISPALGVPIRQLYLLTASAWCSAPGASIQVTTPGGAGPVIPVPPGGSVTIDFDGGVGTDSVPLSVAFVGTDGYFLDWVEEVL